MTDAEMFPFMDTFHNVRRVFPLRGEEHELRQVGASYFKAMRRWPLQAVQAGAEVWLQKGKRFPKPAEWIESIPPRTTTVELAPLSNSDAEAYQRAERLRYEDTPCLCAACREAGVSEQPLRFVPEYHDDTGLDKKALIGERVIVTGHWAHGHELAGYYRAKNEFWFKMHELFGAHTPQAKRKVTKDFEARLKEIYEEKPRTSGGKSDLEPLTGA